MCSPQRVRYSWKHKETLFSVIVRNTYGSLMIAQLITEVISGTLTDKVFLHCWFEKYCLGKVIDCFLRFLFYVGHLPLHM